ncbi:C40 family peptidase, partial [Bacteroides heparinolyticus]
EKGDYTYVQLLLESKSLSDLVNKTEYIEKLYEYDRKMLLKYQEARQAVADAKAKLEEQQEELEVSKHELEDEKSSLDEMLEEKKAEASDYDTQISRAKQEAAAYKAKIKQQNAEIKKLEEAEAAKRRAAEEAAKKSSSSGSVDASSVINGSGGSASGKEIASFACKYVGNPYVAGGTSLTSGCDCSGFTWAVYQNFGYSLPRSSTAQRSAGRGVSYSEAQPGDIICYAGHVALYIGGGRIVHASTPSTGIKYGVATYKEILGVRRIVG